MIRWTGKVGPGNLNSDYAKPVSVLAETRIEAITKMLAAGGYRDSREGSVWITQMSELPASAASALQRIADALERIASSQGSGNASGPAGHRPETSEPFLPAVPDEPRSEYRTPEPSSQGDRP